MSKMDIDKKHITKHFIPFYPQQILFLLLTFGIKFYSLPYFMTIFQRATTLYNATIFQVSAAGSTIGGYFGANVGWFHLVPFSSIAFCLWDSLLFLYLCFIPFLIRRRGGVIFLFFLLADVLQLILVFQLTQKFVANFSRLSQIADKNI